MRANYVSPVKANFIESLFRLFILIVGISFLVQRLEKKIESEFSFFEFMELQEKNMNISE